MSAELKLSELLRRQRDLPIASKSQRTVWYMQAREIKRWLRENEIGSEVPHGLWHHLADPDIRTKDAEYRLVQEQFIQSYIEQLERHATGGLEDSS